MQKAHKCFYLEHKEDLTQNEILRANNDPPASDQYTATHISGIHSILIFTKTAFVSISFILKVQLSIMTPRTYTVGGLKWAIVPPSLVTLTNKTIYGHCIHYFTTFIIDHISKAYCHLSHTEVSSNVCFCAVRVPLEQFTHTCRYDSKVKYGVLTIYIIVYGHFLEDSF